MITLLVPGVSALFLALVLTPIVRSLAVRAGSVDRSGGRRVHDGVVPRLGGFAVFAAITGSLLVTPVFGVDAVALLHAYNWTLGWLAAGTITILAVGVADDLIGLNPLPKIVLQIVAALMVLAGGYGFFAVSNPFSGGVVFLGSFGGLITLFWIVGITNAFNLIDGLDGLATGVGLIASLTLLSVSVLEGRPDAAMLCAVIAGALTGFLFFNFPPASIFLGDSGSLLLGFLLSVLSIQSLQKGTAAVVILVPVLALGLPIAETASTILRRTLVAGIASVFRADQEHIHHRLLDLGINHRRAVLILYGVCAAFGLLSFLAVALRGTVDAMIVVGVSIASFVAIRRLGYGRPHRLPNRSGGPPG